MRYRTTIEPDTAPFTLTNSSDVLAKSRGPPSRAQLPHETYRRRSPELRSQRRRLARDAAGADNGDDLCKDDSVMGEKTERAVAYLKELSSWRAFVEHKEPRTVLWDLSSRRPDSLE